MEWSNGAGLVVSDDPTRVDVDLVHHWLSDDAYWAKGRSRAVVTRSIEGSIPFSLFDGLGAQIGFCRMITDRATFAWLCDVYIEPAHRGDGAGTFLVLCAVEHPDVARIKRQVLATTDAHGLYERFGFERFSDDERERWMLRPGP